MIACENKLENVALKILDHWEHCKLDHNRQFHNITALNYLNVPLYHNNPGKQNHAEIYSHIEKRGF